MYLRINFSQEKLWATAWKSESRGWQVLRVMSKTSLTETGDSYMRWKECKAKLTDYYSRALEGKKNIFKKFCTRNWKWIIMKLLLLIILWCIWTILSAPWKSRLKVCIFKDCTKRLKRGFSLEKWLSSISLQL